MRVQGHGRQAPQLAQRRLHLQLARLQRPLEGIPDERLAEHLLGFEDQETAIGPVQRPGAQLPVGGVQRALVSAVFDPAEQVVVGRVRLEHHRRTAAGRMADHQARGILLFEQLAGHGVSLAVVDQLLDHGPEQIDLHGLQVPTDGRIFRVLFRQRCKQGLQGQGDGFFVQLAQLIVRLTFPLRQAGQFLVEAFLEVGDVGMETLALGLRQLGELCLVEGLAVAHRSKGDIAAVAVQGDVLLQRQALDHVQRAVVALIEGAIDTAFFLLVGRVLEYCRKSRQQIVDQTTDVTDEGAGLARRQLQRTWLPWFIEMVDVNPVRRGLQTLAFGLEVTFDERKPTGSRFAHDEHVVTGAWHRHTELQRFDRAFLAKHTAKRLQIIGGREAELFSGKRASQRFRRKTQAGSNRIRHRASLHQAGQIKRILALPVPGWQGDRWMNPQVEAQALGTVPQKTEFIIRAKNHGTLG